LLERRAEVREQRLDDVTGAMAEWLRVLVIDSGHGRADEELERLAESKEAWGRYLCLPAWRAQVSADPKEEAQQYKRMATIFERRLNKPEHAFRALACAWRCTPELPDLVGSLDEDNAELWRLAGEVGRYRDPELPRDPLTHPELERPELSDLLAWSRQGHDPESFAAISAAPSMELDVPHTSELADIGAILEEDSVVRAPLDANGDASATSPEPNAAEFDEVEEIEELDELEEIEEFEELDELEFIEEIEDEVEVAPASRPPTPPPAKAPPPAPRLPFDLTRGLPALPELRLPLLPKRPACQSAWEELAACYLDAPAGDKEGRLTAHLACARLWDEGADDIEGAFSAHEDALLVVPEHEFALESLAALAERRDARPRLIEAFARLLGDAVLPEHVVAIGLRIAGLHELDEDWNDAESRYRGVLAVQVDHVGALTALAKIYEAHERFADLAQVVSQRLDAEMRDLDEDDRVNRTLELAAIYETRLEEHERVIDLLRVLVRDYPHRPEIHRNIARLFLHIDASAQAIEAMKSGIEATGDGELEREFLPEMARVYEEQLELPRRAIEAWVRMTELDSDYAPALDALARLYLAEGNHDALLPVLEERLVLLSREGDAADPAVRTRVLVLKAKALQDGLGDEEGALKALEELHADTPENDEVRMGLAQLYAGAERLDEAVELLEAKLSQLPAGQDAEQRRELLCLSLCDLLEGSSGGAEKGVTALGLALAKSPANEALLQRRVKLCRQTHQLELLADSLGELPESGGHLEAAEIARVQLRDSARASRLYGRVLAESKGRDDARATRRQLQAIEGLVQLRIAEDDVEGAMAFMDKQLAEVDRPEVEAQLLTEIGRITYRATKDVEGARARFEAALALDSSHPGASLGLGELALASDDLPTAESAFEKAIEAFGFVDDQSGLVDALVGLAKVFERSDRAGEAYRRLNTALRHDTENLGIRTALVRNRFEARRWRDVLTAADKLDASLSERGEMGADDRRLAGTIFTYAASAERELKHNDKALARLEQALAVDPDNGRALDEFLPILRERGEFERAAQMAARRAELADDRADRAAALFDSGALFHEAATALRTTGTGERDAERESELRGQGFDALRRSLSLAKEDGSNLLSREQLESAFRLAAGAQPDVALDCADRLLARDDLEPDFREELLLDAAKLATLTGREGDAERALELARAAVESSPTSTQALLTLADALESRGDSAELESAIGAYFDRVPTPQPGEGDTESMIMADARTRHAQVELLGRLARSQADDSNKAIHSLEHALAIDPQGLALEARQALADHYVQLDRGLNDPDHGPRVRANLDAMLALDPLDVASLARLGEDCVERGELNRAHALFTVVALRDPANEGAAAFAAAHELVETGQAQLNLALLDSDRDSAGGVPEALSQVWDAGAALLGDLLPDATFDPAQRVSPVGDGTLARSWGEVLKHVGQTKVAFIDAPELAASLGHGDQAGGFVHLCAQSPPILIADAQAASCEDEATLRFAIARALYLARPEALLIAGLERSNFTKILDAILLAFHPRHAKRKSATRGSDDPVPKLAQEFSRKLPIRVSRQIGSAFKEAADEPFDSRAFGESLSKSGNRVGLAIAGDVRAGLRVVLGDFEAGESLAERVAESNEARELVAFSLTPTYVELRESMGVEVRRKG
jgi:tetratricopeptide (TPR) repeat protein